MKSILALGNSLGNLGSGVSCSVPKLSGNALTVCGNIVRDDLFKVVKFLDKHTLLQTGPEIYTRFLRQTGQLDVPNMINNVALYTAVIRKAKHYINVHKCHAKRKIRQSTSSKFTCGFV